MHKTIGTIAIILIIGLSCNNTTDDRIEQNIYEQAITYFDSTNTPCTQLRISDTFPINYLQSSIFLPDELVVDTFGLSRETIIAIRYHRILKFSCHINSFKEFPLSIKDSADEIVRLTLDPSFREPFMIKLQKLKEGISLTIKMLPWNSCTMNDNGFITYNKVIPDSIFDFQIFDQQNFSDIYSSDYLAVSDGNRWIIEYKTGINHYCAFKECPYRLGENDSDRFILLAETIIDILPNVDIPPFLRDRLDEAIEGITPFEEDEN